VDELKRNSIKMNATHWDVQIISLSKSVENFQSLRAYAEALGMVQQRCDRPQLSVSPQKIVIVPLTRRDLRDLKEPTLSGHKLQLTMEVIYLRLILDMGLTWKSMQENVIRLTGPCGPVRIYTVTTGT
jgi:hypothetical protein